MNREENGDEFQMFESYVISKKKGFHTFYVHYVMASIVMDMSYHELSNFYASNFTSTLQNNKNDLRNILFLLSRNGPSKRNHSSNGIIKQDSQDSIY